MRKKSKLTNDEMAFVDRTVNAPARAHSDRSIRT